jgi:hypothetical protein
MTFSQKHDDNDGIFLVQNLPPWCSFSFLLPASSTRACSCSWI